METVSFTCELDAAPDVACFFLAVIMLIAGRHISHRDLQGLSCSSDSASSSSSSVRVESAHLGFKVLGGGGEAEPEELTE
jgi:hypothetical protein